MFLLKVFQFLIWGTEFEPKSMSPSQAMKQKLLDKLHYKTGHRSNTALQLLPYGAMEHILKLWKWQKSIKKLFCHDCQELCMAPLHDSLSLEKPETLWET